MGDVPAGKKINERRKLECKIKNGRETEVEKRGTQKLYANTKNTVSMKDRIVSSKYVICAVQNET